MKIKIAKFDKIKRLINLRINHHDYRYAHKQQSYNILTLI